MTDTGDQPRGQSQRTGKAGQPARRPERLRSLERLLGNISRHLRATGNRHSDILKQLHDRLGYLHSDAVGASPDADRHLTLFEAQLTSLAIKTGVPMTPPQRPVHSGPFDQGHNALPPLDGSLPRAPQPATPPAPVEKKDPSPPPAANSPYVRSAGTTAAPAVSAAPQAARLPELPPAKPIGAPPPLMPAPRPAETDPLGRMSDMTFEDALAADQKTAQRNAVENAASKDGGDAIFAYQPPREAPAKKHSPVKSPVPSAIEPTIPSQPTVQAEATTASARTTTDAQSVAEAVNPDETKKDALPAHSGKGSPAPSSARDTMSSAEPRLPNAVAAAPESDLLRKDLESALSRTLPATQKPRPSRVEPAPAPVSAQPRVEAALFKTPENTSLAADGKNPTAADASDDALPPRVLDEIAKLTKRVDAVAGHVDQLASDISETRAEIPKIVETSSMAAAQQVAKEAAASDSAVNSRLDDLQNLIEGYVVNQRDESQAGSSMRPRSHSHAPVDQAPQELSAVTDQRQPFEVQPSQNSVLSQAKQTVLDRLAPVGNALSRRVTKSEPMPTDVVHAEESATTEAVQPADPQTPEAGTQPAEIYPQQTLPAPTDQHGHTVQDSQMARSVDRPMSDLRKSIFQNNAPPALVLAFLVMTLAGGVLIWNGVGGDEEKKDSTRIASSAEPKPLATKSIQRKVASAATQPLTKAPTPKAANRVAKPKPAARLAASLPQPIKPKVVARNEPIEETGSIGRVRPSVGTARQAAPLSPTALTPDAAVIPKQPMPAGGSKLQLPPLATGPLSLRIAAANGDPAAQFDVASRLAQGNGIGRDPVAAVKWYTRAASAGHAQAQYRLAALYERGTGVAADSGRAKVWYTRAAQQGNVKAMHNLAVLYAGQASGTPNYVNAVQWFEKAAEHDLADSQFNVAILYMNGLGVGKDLIAAHKWFSLASRQGDQEARRRLTGLQSRLSAADSAKAKRVVRAWRAKPVNQDANVNKPWRPKSASVTPAAAAPMAATVAKAVTDPKALRKSNIETAQRILGTIGFDAGKPDGKMGSKTRSAIKSFQTRNGMIPTGRIDDGLIRRLKAAERERAKKLGLL